MLRKFLVLTALLGVSACGGAPGSTDSAQSSAGESQSAPAADTPHCDKRRAIGAVERFEASNLYLGKDFNAADGLVLLVDEAVWKATPLDMRKIAVAEYDCAFAAPDYLRGVHLRTGLHGPDFDSYQPGDLIDARRLLQRLNEIQDKHEADDRAAQAASAAAASSAPVPAALTVSGEAEPPAATPPSQ